MKNSQFSILNVPALCVAALLTLAFGPLDVGLLPSARAQGFSAYAPATLVAGGTNIVAAASTNTYGTLTLTRQEHLALQLSFRCAGTNTSTIQFFLDPSLDGETFDTSNDDYTYTLTGNGTNLITVVTNLPGVNAIGYARLRVGNPNATVAITNLTVKYAIKR